MGNDYFVKDFNGNWLENSSCATHLRKKLNGDAKLQLNWAEQVIKGWVRTVRLGTMYRQE